MTGICFLYIIHTDLFLQRMNREGMKETQSSSATKTDNTAETVKIANASVDQLHILICDDEEAHIRQLQQLLEQLSEEVSLRITADRYPEKLLQQLEERVRCGEALPDVIFLDIRMPEVDGIAFGKALRNLAPEVYVVFTTAYKEYAVEGYEVQAFRYLLKPLTKETAQKVLKEIRKDMGRQKRLVIKHAEEERILSLSEIIYLSAEDKYTVLYTTDGYYVDRTSLTDYEALLAPYGFYRIHRKYIVNFRHHKSMGKGCVTLSQGVRLPVSRRREAAYYTELFNGLGKELIR